MVCGPDFSIKDVVAKWPGYVHDSRIFKETALCREFENGMLFGMFYLAAMLYPHHLSKKLI